MNGPFGFEIKRPGEYGNTAGLDEWALELPHQCDEWTIGYGDLAAVIAAAKRFRTELGDAISELERLAEAEPQ